ncbi:sulfurtransferase TusA family protein [Thermodesulfovibrio hydrogeniphilus]
MADKIFDYRGLKCPHPILKLSAQYPNFKKGEIIEVIADCPTFEKDIKVWCNKLSKTILNIEKQGNTLKVTIKI